MTFVFLAFKLCHLKRAFCAAGVRLIAVSQSSHPSPLQTLRLSAHLGPCQRSTEHLEARLVQPGGLRLEKASNKMCWRKCSQNTFHNQNQLFLQFFDGPLLAGLLGKELLHFHLQAQKGHERPDKLLDAVNQPDSRAFCCPAFCMALRNAGA